MARHDDFKRPRPNPVGDLIISDTRLGVGVTDNLSTLTVQARAPFTLTGTLTSSDSTTAVTGVGTHFLSELAIGDRISMGTTYDPIRSVATISSDTALTVDRVFLDASVNQANVQASPSAARFDAADGSAQVVVNDQGNVGIGTVGPNAQLEVSGLGAGDYYDCPTLLRLHYTQTSDAWQLVLSVDSDNLQPGAIVWVQAAAPGEGAILHFTMYDGDHSHAPIEPLSLDGNSVHLNAGINTNPQTIGPTDYTVQPNDYHLIADGGTSGMTVTLPASSNCGGRTLVIFKAAGAGAVTVAPASGDMINGSTSSKTISTLFNGLQLVLVGTTWFATVLTGA